MDSLIEIATLAALFINTVALLIVIYQTNIAKRSLTITKKSIDDAKTQTKFTWIIEVQVQLEYWKKDLQERKNILQKGLNEKNDEMVKKAGDTRIKIPKDLALNRFLYDNMPPWLRDYGYPVLNIITMQ